jgi:hypothetical protein
MPAAQPPSKSRHLEIAIAPMPKRYPLTTVLKHLDRAEASSAVALLAKGLASAIEKGDLAREDAELLLFNLDVLLFTEGLGGGTLRMCIAHGMELEDIEELIATPEAMRSGCSAVRALADQVLGLDARGLERLDLRNP